MDYAESLKWYDALSRSGIKPGLERVGELLEKLGNPHKKLKYVHVAGTNGKGSFCSVMSGILSCAGYKTGLFTSPFVFGFEEQLQIDGKYISENALARLFTCVEEKCAGMSEQPTAFEALTAAAFLYFYEQKCDFAVVECGMGGKNDCTNIIPSPEVAALMSVSKDHTAYLGDTVEKIAQEKCGIFKNGCYAVCYPENGDFPQPPQVVGVFKHSCEKANARYSMANLNNITVLEENLTSSLVGTPYGKITIPFAGRHQLANFATVLEAVKALRERGYIISDADIKNGTQKAYMPARLEKLSDKPLVILDGGHNPGCADAVNGFF
ncbi:MAG: bifunctional folylpolyglutamate synthase/dihydrofolate synthase, partial [Clostridia bacterium]|nr:bifunctional folylpolyglutamate synthase/dihydrofolate synthase [Clostridia bacterium]